MPQRQSLDCLFVKSKRDDNKIHRHQNQDQVINLWHGHRFCVIRWVMSQNSGRRRDISPIDLIYVSPLTGSSPGYVDTYRYAWSLPLPVPVLLLHLARRLFVPVQYLGHGILAWLCNMDPQMLRTVLWATQTKKCRC